MSVRLRAVRDLPLLRVLTSIRLPSFARFVGFNYFLAVRCK